MRTAILALGAVFFVIYAILILGLPSASAEFGGSSVLEPSLIFGLVGTVCLIGAAFVLKLPKISLLIFSCSSVLVIAWVVWEYAMSGSVNSIWGDVILFSGPLLILAAMTSIVIMKTGSKNKHLK